MSERLRPNAVSEVVELSYWTFALWWMFLFGIHVITCIYTALYSYSYWVLKHTYLNNYLEDYEIGLPPPYYRGIAIIHALMSALHAICIFLMLGGSIWQRSLAFTPWASCQAKEENDDVSSTRNSSFVARSITRIYSTISDRHGLFGVNGMHFHILLILREIIETGLQTYQAYRMSQLLPNVLLNRFFVLMLAINCWSSVVVYSIFLKWDEASRRFACIFLDCVLDLIACMGVELMIVLRYAKDYDLEMRGFWDYTWQDGEWAARALNEFRLVFVVSWTDLASRVVFALGLLLTTTNMKELLQRHADHTTTPMSSSGAGTIKGQILGSTLCKVVPTSPNLKAETSTLKDEQCKMTLLVESKDTYRGTKLRTQCARFMLRAAHLLFGIWGILVLGLHIHASVQPTLRQCLLQVRPWATSRPYCYLVGLDCHTLEISGRIEEVEKVWSEFDSSSVVQLLICHCPALSMPSLISEFHKLHGVKVYNTTIVEWNESAAFTSMNHPDILSLYIVRVNMTNGVLPPGFQSIDFPSNLFDIALCVTNLRMIPDDLDSKWPRTATLLIEYSQLTSVYPVLLRLEPKYLALTGNPITDVPAEVFEIPGLRTLGLADLNITELPRYVNPVSTLNSIFLENTSISFFWPWIDDLITTESFGVLVPINSPYCIDYLKIFDGTADTFSSPPSPEHASILMDPSQAIGTWNIVCDGASAVNTYYYITLDDEIIAISPPPALIRP